jgi:hypothetical protein
MDESWKCVGIQKIFKEKVMAYNKAAFNVHNNKSKFTAGYEKNKKAMSKLAPFLLSTQPEDVYHKQQPYEKPLYLKMRKRPKDYFDESMMWIGKRYIANNITKRNLAVGDLVLIQADSCCVEPPQPTLGIVWYGKKMVEIENTLPFFTHAPASRYSLIVKILEGRKGESSNLWVPGEGLDYLHPNDEWINDRVFIRLEPVQWWIGKNATTQSDQFRAAAGVLGIPESVYKDLP